MASRAARYLLSVLVCTRLRLLTSRQVVWEGQSVNLSCGSNCSIRNDLFWWQQEHLIARRLISKNGEPENTSDDVTLYADGTLNIHSVTFSNYMYTCKCGVDHVKVELEVHREVKSLRLTGPVFPRSENTKANFTCRAEGGNPAPYISWQMPVRPAETHYREERGPVSHRTLILQSSMDRSVIGCSVIKQNGTLVASLILNITYKPRISLRIRPRNYVLGDRVDLVCLAFGNPEPAVSWEVVAGNTVHQAANDTIFTISRLNQTHKDMYRYRCWAENSEGFDERELTLTPQTVDLALFMNLGLMAVSAAGLLGITVFVLLYACGGIRLPINCSSHVDNGSSGMAERELIDELFNAPDYDPEMYLHPTAAGDDSSIAPADREDLDSLGYHVPTSLSTLSSLDEDFFPVANARNVLRGLPHMEAEENVYDTEMYLHHTQTPRGETDIDGEDNQAANSTRTTTPTTTPASTPTTTYISQMPRVAAEHNVYYSFDEFQNN